MSTGRAYVGFVSMYVTGLLDVWRGCLYYSQAWEAAQQGTGVAARCSSLAADNSFTASPCPVLKSPRQSMLLPEPRFGTATVLFLM